MQPDRDRGCDAPVFMMFEGRKPKAREIMVISVLAAIGVAGRAAFLWSPVSNRWRLL